MNKIILFDLDGTLTDSGEGVINCALVALQHFNLPLPSREELRVIIGPPLRDSFLRFGVAPEDVEEAVEIYRRRYVPVGMFENRPYPGISAMLAALRDMGYKLYVATSKPETMAIEILDKFMLSGYFHKIYGASMDGTRDTKDKVIAYVLEDLNCQNNMIMVGDTLYDVLGAAAHGIKTVGVTWGYGTKTELVDAGAIETVDTPSQLLDYFEALL
jgi:phosphoglycolate phosphatase